jgi:hypothetical protein
MILQCEESSVILYSGRRRRCSISMERKTKGRTLFIGFVGFARDLCKYSKATDNLVFLFSVPEAHR